MLLVLIAAAPAPAKRDSLILPPAPRAVPIWPGKAPGTADWTGPEIALDAKLPAGLTHVVTNVTVPSLSVFGPDPRIASRAAMIVVPGGAFRALAADLEGSEVATWLASRGITAFVLHYRVRPPAASAPAGAESFAHFLDCTAPARRIAAADAVQALKVVRARAQEFKIDPHAVGMIGFSAGAITALDVATSGSAAERPDFLVSAYGALPDRRRVPGNAPPLFIVAARDDPQIAFADSIAMRDRWTAAHRRVELHLYAKGGHGFGMRKQGLPVDRWPLLLDEWLKARGAVGQPPTSSRPISIRRTSLVPAPMSSNLASR